MTCFIKKLALPFFSLLLLFASCLKKAEVNEDGSIALTFDTVTVIKGNSVKLTSKRYDAGLLLWRSSDTTIATVSPDGTVYAKKAGRTAIIVSHKTYAITATCTITITEPTLPPVTDPGDNEQIPGSATDIGIGADGSVFIVGTDQATTTGGFSIYKYNGTGFTKMPDCAGVRIAVSPQGMPWVVNKLNRISRYNGTTWEQLPGTATDIGIGADGSVFAISDQAGSPTGGYTILKWTGNSWTTMYDCSGLRIAVSPQGIPWVVNASSLVYKFTGNVLWSLYLSVLGNDIGIGADGSVYVTGMVSPDYKPTLKKYNQALQSWEDVPGAYGVNLAVSPKGLPWWITSNNQIFKKKG